MTKEIKYRKVAIVGCGFVGASTAYSLMRSGLFSEIVLIDRNMAKAEGEALDISHGLPFSKPAKVYAGEYKDLADAEIVIVTAGAGQKPGETRLDLVKKNVAIFKQIIPQISQYNKDCILLIISNPVDILTLAAAKIGGFKPNMVFGSGTVLDTARLKFLLGEHLGVDPRSVHAFIIGEHGDSEIAVWSSANVSGIPLHRFCEMRGFFDHETATKQIADNVKNSAYEIIEKKGATYYGIATTVTRICEAIVRDEKSILPVSSIIDGAYGVDNVAISLPAIVGKDGIEAIAPINLSEDEALRLKESADLLKKIAGEVL